MLATLPPVCLAMPPKAKSIAVPDAEASEPVAMPVVGRKLASAKFGELERAQAQGRAIWQSGTRW